LRPGRSVRHPAALITVELPLKWEGLQNHKTEVSERGALKFPDCF
jgi:hypothetical protein